MRDVTILCFLFLLLFEPFDRLDAMEVRVIYRCQANGVTTFADKPCDAVAQPYETDNSRISSYAPEPPAASESPASKSPASAPEKRPRARAAADPGKKAANCEHVNSALRTIAGKMRSGYGVREGEKLRDRKSQLEAKRRQLRCR